MSDVRVSPETDAELENVETQRRIGAQLRAKFPGLSPYSAAREAATQLFPGLSAQRSEAHTGPNELAHWEQTGPLSGTMQANEAQILQSPFAKALRPQDREDYLAGVYAHELLGHGGDTWLSRGKFQEYPETDVNHFMGLEPPALRRVDDISDMEPSIQGLQDPEAFRRHQSALDEQARQEARSRGVPTELPSQTTAEKRGIFLRTFGSD